MKKLIMIIGLALAVSNAFGAIGDSVATQISAIGMEPTSKEKFSIYSVLVWKTPGNYLKCYFNGGQETGFTVYVKSPELGDKVIATYARDWELLSKDNNRIIVFTSRSTNLRAIYNLHSNTITVCQENLYKRLGTPL